jgi:hypothetical protein
MAVFTIQAPDGRKIKIEAADETTALRGAQEWTAANPKVDPTSHPAFAAASEASGALTGKVSGLPSQRPTLGDEVMSFGRGVIEGIPVAGPTLSDWRRGLDANIAALLQGKDPEALKAGYEQQDEELRAKTGGSRTAGGITGAIASLAPLGGTAIGGRLLGMTGSLPSRLMAGGASGAALSGADTAARGGGIEDIGASMALGAGLGTVFPAIGGIKNALGNTSAQNKAISAAIKDAPDMADLKKVASDLFENSRAAGAGVEGQTFANFAADLAQKAKAADIDDILDGDALAAYKRMVQMAQEGLQTGGISLSRLHNLRQLAQDVAIDATKDRTKRFAGQLVDGLDDLIENLQPGQMVGQGGPQAASDLMEGISTWARAKKLGMIEEAITKAGYQKSGMENGLRLQFLAILRDPKKRAAFTPTEIAEIEKVANGTVGTNIVHLLGKFGFGLGNGGTNAMGGTIGALLGGLPGVAVTSGARKLAEVLTSKAADRAAKVVATPNIPTVAPKALANELLAPAVLPLEATRKREPLQITVRGGRPTS